MYRPTKHFFCGAEITIRSQTVTSSNGFCSAANVSVFFLSPVSKLVLTEMKTKVMSKRSACMHYPYSTNI